MTPEQEKAIDRLIEAFAIRQPRKFLPYGFPREMLQGEMPAEATDEEIEAARKTLIFDYWTALKVSPDYPPSEELRKDEFWAAMYSDFGELGDDFGDWWRNRGRNAFAEEEGSAIRVMFDSEGGVEFDDLDGRASGYGRLLIVEVNLHVPPDDAKKDFELLLDRVHAKGEHENMIYRHAKRRVAPLDGRPETLRKELAVLQEYQKNQLLPEGRRPASQTAMWLKMSKGLKITGNSQEALLVNMRESFNRANRLVFHAARGDFPRRD